MSEKPRTAEYPFHAWPRDQVQPDSEDAFRYAVEPLTGGHEPHELPRSVAPGGLPVGRVEFHSGKVGVTVGDSPAWRITSIEGPFADNLRAEGAAAERERIRLELIAESDRQFTGNRFGARALSDFARRLEVPRDAFAVLDHSDLPGECPAILWHGPGHQSRSRCRLSGPHAIHETIYGSSRQYARWEGDKAFTGVFNEPPTEPSR